MCKATTAIYYYLNNPEIISLSRTMSDEEAIKTAATVGTAPLWVPAAAAGGIVYGAGKGKRDILDVNDTNNNKKNISNERTYYCILDNQIKTTC
jgi:hypothetical protein